MGESLVQVTEGTGKKLATWSRVRSGGNTTEEEYVLPGEVGLASYVVVAENVSTATALSHMLQIMAGASLNVRIRRILVDQANHATAANLLTVELFRLTTAGTGGTVLTPSKYDNADAASGATAMTLPTAKGTEGVQLAARVLTLRQALLATSAQQNDRFEWVQHPGMKPIIIPAGAANGIAIKNLTGIAGASLTMTVELVETAFV